MNTQELYEQLRQRTDDNWADFSGKIDGDFGGLDAGQMRVSLGLLSRVAKNYDFDDFRAAVEENEMPPIKLTSEEQELLNGGETSSCTAEGEGEGFLYWASKFVVNTLQFWK